jgi:hypothetical protein
MVQQRGLFPKNTNMEGWWLTLLGIGDLALFAGDWGFGGVSGDWGFGIGDFGDRTLRA